MSEEWRPAEGLGRALPGGGAKRAFVLPIRVFGTRLCITTLRAAAGLAIEFLEYVAPRDGRPFPADARANGLLHWQTTLAARDLDATAHQVRDGMFPLMSPDIVTLSASQLGFTKGGLVRDPDGHAMQLIAP